LRDGGEQVVAGDAGDGDVEGVGQPPVGVAAEVYRAGQGRVECPL
jgi:hypothetical protein